MKIVSQGHEQVEPELAVTILQLIFESRPVLDVRGRAVCFAGTVRRHASPD